MAIGSAESTQLAATGDERIDGLDIHVLTAAASILRVYVRTIIQTIIQELQERLFISVLLGLSCVHLIMLWE